MIPSYFLCFMAFGAVSPYLSLLVRSLGYSHFWVGLLLGVFEGAGIAGPFVFGFLADRSGSYRSGIIASYAIPALAVIPLVLVINPIISAILLACFAFAFRSTSSLLDAVTTIQLGKTGNYGKIRAFGSISFIIMVLFLQWTPFFRPNTAEHIAFWMGLSSAAACIPILLLPRSAVSPERDREKSPKEKSPGTGRIISMYFVGGFAIIFLSRLAMAAVYTYFPLYLVEVMRWDVVGLMFGLAAAAEVPCMFISARLLRRFGALPLLALSAAGISVRLILWALFPVKAVIIGAQMLHSLCFGIFHPAAVHFIATSIPPKKRALGMSLYLALGSGFPSLIGNIIGGAIVDSAGYVPLFASFAGFGAAAVVIFAALRITRQVR